MHAGFSTYESMYRARDVFGAKRIVVVPRTTICAVRFVAERLGLDAWVPTCVASQEEPASCARPLAEMRLPPSDCCA